MLLVLTGLMVVASPVATMAMAGNAHCGQQMSAASHHDAAMLHGADHHGGHAMHQPDQDDSASAAPICCDHACVAEVPMPPHVQTVLQDGVSLPRHILSQDLTQLTHPNGLRRPPKA